MIPALLLPLLLPCSPLPEDARPNVVVFLVDDLGWQDSSVAFDSQPGPFQQRYRTPHLEGLAARGVRFASAYACAVCSPSRTSLMTGRNAARHGVTNWTFTPGQDTSGPGPLASPPDWRTDGLQPEDGPSLAARLREAGYFTIHAGKAHWGGEGSPGADPRNLGFDVNIAGHHAGGPGSYHGEHDFSAAWRGGGTRWDVPGLEHYEGLPVHLTDAVTVEALRAVDRAVEREQPFYLYLAHYAVHAPIEAHRPYDANYPELDPEEARYASMVEGYDASLGAVLRHLERRGVASRTLVLFTSDNGGLTVHGRGRTPAGTGRGTHNAPLRAGKGSAYEGGTRVPWLVAWALDADVPAQRRIPVQAGARRLTPVMIEDVFPTVLAWAGVEFEDARVDGRDLTPLLAAEGEGPRSGRPLVFHYPHVWGPRQEGMGYEPHSSLRRGGHKAIWFHEGERWELYDLVEDPGETRDLAQQRPELLRELAAELVSELERLGAGHPVRREDGTPVYPRVP